MANLFIINAPFLFKGVWAIVKGFVDEKTRAKIEIIGGSYHKKLFAEVDPKQVPNFLGGECNCDPSGGDCLSTVFDMGPWNDYKITGVKQVALKGADVPTPTDDVGEVTEKLEAMVVDPNQVETSPEEEKKDDHESTQ